MEEFAVAVILSIMAVIFAIVTVILAFDLLHFFQCTNHFSGQFSLVKPKNEVHIQSRKHGIFLQFGQIFVEISSLEDAFGGSTWK